jgi:hypothetical protein
VNVAGPPGGQIPTLLLALSVKNLGLDDSLLLDSNGWNP